MSDLTTLQNSDSSIRLLAAQRRLYSEAKKWQALRMVGAIALTALSPLILFLWPSGKVYFAFVGGLLTLLSVFALERLEKQKTRYAANAQEQFDTSLFGLPWNGILVGPKTSLEVIASAARAREDTKDLENWYADPGEVPLPVAALMCQRSNLVWDWRLRRAYATALAAIAIAIFASGIVLALVTRQTLLDYILILLVPSLPALQVTIGQIVKHHEVASTKEDLADKLSGYFPVDTRQDVIDQAFSRTVQDRIYSLRATNAFVPDWFYQLLHKRYEADMKEAITYLGRGSRVS